MTSNIDNDMPQWKKDLIARLRNQNKRLEGAGGLKQQLCCPQTSDSVGRTVQVQQPILTSTVTVVSVNSSASVTEKCKVLSSTTSKGTQSKMVQERVWVMDPVANLNGFQKESDSDSSEDLQYGPGIVSKLKNKYLSLALRETGSRMRPSILQMRKAASLENILDDCDSNVQKREHNGLFQQKNGNDCVKNVSNRYRSTTRANEMKRARSVEVISRNKDVASEEVRPKRESYHEDVISKNKVPQEKPYKKLTDPVETVNKYHRINRPQRIAPIMNEKEKPPADVVKQAKLIFERRPEQRTKAPPLTGEVAAKVDTYNNIIVKAKAAKKPLIKHKPNLEKIKTTQAEVVARKTDDKPRDKLILSPVAQPSKKFEGTILLPSPIPDVSQIDFHVNTETERTSNSSSLSETPDLILTSRPVAHIISPTYLKQSTEKFIKKEKEKPLSPFQFHNVSEQKPRSPEVLHETDGKIEENPPGIFKKTPINKNVLNTKTPPSELLNIEITTEAPKILSPRNLQSPVATPSPPSKIIVPTTPSPITSPKPSQSDLTVKEIEQNHKNTVKSLQQPKPSESVCLNNSEVNKIIVPRKRAPNVACNTEVFNFTNRKDVPDYISNDRSRGSPQLSKTDQDGLILLANVAISEEDEEEIMRSLKAPPSPCDVTFINDNILIDGKSSLSQKTKKMKMRISFVEASPEVFEYPSESTASEELPPLPVSNNAQIGHSVPIFAGTSLANYTPKSTEEFEPGVTRSIQNNSLKLEPLLDDSVDNAAEVDKIMFSSGTNSDILF